MLIKIPDACTLESRINVSLRLLTFFSNYQETEIEKTNKNHACKNFYRREGVTFIPTRMSTLECRVLKVRSLMYLIFLKNYIEVTFFEKQI